jgi:hypothetical protein
VVGKLLTNKLFTDEHLDTHHNMIEAMLGVVGTLFSLLLGLLVAAAINNYRDVKDQVSLEANGVADVFRVARGLSDVDRPRIRNICRQYVDALVKEEWPAMEQNKMSEKAWAVYQDLWEAAVAVNPSDNRESNLQQSILSSIQSVGENRRARAVTSTNNLPAPLWITIAAGSLITIVFTFLLTTKIDWIPNLMTGLIAASLGLNIWLLAEYSSPFQGALHVPDSPFTVLQEITFNQPDTPSRYLQQLKEAAQH